MQCSRTIWAEAWLDYKAVFPPIHFFFIIIKDIKETVKL